MSLRDDSRLNKLEEQMAQVLKELEMLRRAQADEMSQWLANKEQRKTLTLRKNG